MRHSIQGLFVQSPDRWTDDPDLAFDFRFIDHALKYANVWELEGVELAFAFDNPRQVTAVPLEEAALRFAAA